jgi:class 3 adenylate cyclase
MWLINSVANAVEATHTVGLVDTFAHAATVQPLPAETHVLDAERHQLTVMFCDLVDSTELSGIWTLRMGRGGER